MRSSSSQLSKQADVDDSTSFVKLPVSLIRSVLDLPPKRGRGRGGHVTAAIRRLFGDLTTFFGVPAPMRKLLEQDRASQGISSNTQYYQWLILQRAAELERRGAVDPSRPS